MATTKKKAERKLASYVHINGEVYKPGTGEDALPADVVEQITNPNAWTSEADEPAEVDADGSGE